jgi:hypothetical protein
MGKHKPRDPTMRMVQKSRELMEQFLLERKLNPAIVPTKKGFLRIFCAWILDEDLPWTTGESPMLKNLFKYLNVNYGLPSDTTVCNELSKIFIELHHDVVSELEVREQSNSSLQHATYKAISESNRRLRL